MSSIVSDLIGWFQGCNSAREYIATQAPKLSTISDLWRMIWQYNCTGIVMLTNLVEGGKVSCRELLVFFGNTEMLVQPATIRLPVVTKQFRLVCLAVCFLLQEETISNY